MNQLEEIKNEISSEIENLENKAKEYLEVPYDSREYISTIKLMYDLKLKKDTLVHVMNIIKMVEYKKNIGKKVSKKQINSKGKPYTPRPFKSTYRYNTVNDVILHPILNIPAYTFLEDDSYVECRRCQVIEENNLVS